MDIKVKIKMVYDEISLLVFVNYENSVNSVKKKDSVKKGILSKRNFVKKEFCQKGILSYPRIKTVN
jgi:hypothetical protein